MSTFTTRILGELIEYGGIYKEDCSNEEKFNAMYERMKFVDSMLIDKLGKNWENLDKDLAEDLDFMLWTDDESVDEEIKSIEQDENLDADDKGNKIILTENTRNLYLIPLYLRHLIPNGLKVYSISGEEIIKDKENIDNDNRFGVLAYGIHIKEEN